MRRDSVSAVVALAVVLSGCIGLTSTEFDARPVSLDEAVVDELGYVEIARQPVPVEKTVVVSRVRITNHVALYSTVPEGTDATETTTLALLSTPAAEVAGQQANPLALGSAGEFAAGDLGTEVLSRAGMGEADELNRSGAPERVATTPARFLGEDRNVTTFASVRTNDDGEAQVRVVHVARAVTDDGVVVALAVDQRPVRADRGGELVGPDGAITQEELDAGIADVRRALGGVRFE